MENKSMLVKTFRTSDPNVLNSQFEEWVLAEKITIFEVRTHYYAKEIDSISVESFVIFAIYTKNGK